MEGENYSFAGKILRVDLTSGKIWTEPTANYASRFLGGRGIDIWILYNEVKPWVTPFDPANRLIFGTGVLVGTLAPCATRHTVEAKSPMTGGVGSANSCGHFSPELKFAGYDHIVFQGRSRKPVYLWIDDGRIKLMDASHIWGRTTWETDDQIKLDLEDEDIQIACIGPAGENLARSACIMTNRARAAARCGLGAVMGSKNLKAIAVRGTGAIEVAHPERFMEAVDEAWEKIRLSEGASTSRAWGTYKPPRPWFFNERGLMPVRNFQDAYMNPERFEKISPEVLKREYEVGRLGYFACPIYCSHFYRLRSGPYAGLTLEGFETNDLWNWWVRFDMDCPSAAITLHALCNEYGLDEDNASCAIAWAFECYQRGIITGADTGGLKLQWGDYGVVAELVKKIAYREGFGDVLAEGGKRASEIIGRGSQEYVVHLKGQDSMEPMRAAKEWALGCVVSPRGGAHTRGANLVGAYREVPPEVSQRIWGIPKLGGLLSYENKAKLVVYYERLQAVLDSLNVCLFSSNWIGLDMPGPEDLAKLYSAATGREVDGDELMALGERIHNLEKAFNVLHAGFSRIDDYPPPRLMAEPIKSGPCKGERLERDKWDEMLDEYYELHGWDKKTGWQTRDSLKELDLEEVADEMGKAGRLPA